MTQSLESTTRGGKWPDVTTVPRVPVRAAIAATLFGRMANRLPLRVELPDGTGFGAATDGPVLRLLRPAAFYHRVGAGGLIGFGEAYQAGDWDSDDLPGLLSVMASHIANLVPKRLQWLRRAYVAAMPPSQDNTPANAAKNISEHYDLSNELFGAFLDETMTYSAAMFDGDETWDALPDAQRRKIDRLLDGIGVTAGTRLLEIGSGWGELAVRAARRGATVHTVTLSQRQLEHTRAYAAKAGVADRIHAELRDYRDLRGMAEYDAIASVEMIEAVGERYWPTYFSTLDRLLVPDGRVGIQAITMPHDRMTATKRTYTWIHKYIFPGGLIPSVTAIKQQVAANTRLSVLDGRGFGADYAATLRLWRERFARNTEVLSGLGFDDMFKRTWQFYLAYSQAGFASGYLNVHQFILGRASA